MRYINNSEGYSLLLSLVILILFTVLGMSLIGMTLNGVTKNETRQNTTQSNDVATMGIERLKSQLVVDLKNAVPSAGMTNLQFETLLLAQIDRYSCPPSNVTTINNTTYKILQTTETGAFRTCIEKEKTTNIPDSFTKKIVKLRSIGNSKGKESTVYSDFEIGAEDVKKVLNYTVSANKNNNNAGGNIYFHGGSEITGDLKVDGHVFTTKQGYGLGRWADSVLPRTFDSKLYSPGNFYTFKNLPNSNSNSPDYSNHTNEISIPSKTNANSLYSKINFQNDSSKVFDAGYIPEYFPTTEVIEPIKFDEEFNINTNGFSNNFNLPADGSNVTFSNNIYTNNKVVINKNLNIKLNKILYINNDLQIGESSFTNSNIFKNITLDGTEIFVKGNVTIYNVDLQANFILYATGNVTIRNVKISGIKSQQTPERGSMYVFSNGNLSLSNLSEYENTPSTIKGFFYSSGTMELYGFGSNTKIIGGIAGNNIILNAMRGKSKANLSDWETITVIEEYVDRQCGWTSIRNFPYFQYVCEDITRTRQVSTPKPYQAISASNNNNDYYETGTNQVNLTSRLQVIYNEELIDGYKNLVKVNNRLIRKEDVFSPIENDRNY